jgi:hypothetical protein
MNAYVGPCVLFILGAALFAYGANLAPYHDPNWDEQILDQSLMMADQPRAFVDSLTAAWQAARAKAQTGRNEHMDLGAGLAALGVSMVLLFLFRRVRSWRDFSALESPSSRVGFVALAAVIWLSFVPAEWYWLGYTQSRGDHPWWADSLAIPMSQILAFGLFGLPIIILGAWFAVRGTVLPVRLWTRPVVAQSYVVAPLFIVAAVVALTVLLSSIVAAPFIVPSTLFAVYLLLSARAAAARRRLTRA